MFFKKNDEAELQKVLQADEADRRELQTLERQLHDLLPQWEKLQQQAEEAAARYQNSDYTYSPQICEDFWRTRGPGLKARILELVEKRDSLTTDLTRQITETKGRLHRRHSRVTGGFGSWAGQVSGQLPEPMGHEIIQACRDIQKIEDLGQVFGIIESWLTKIADLDETAVSIPLLNLGRLVREVAAKEGLA